MLNTLSVIALTGLAAATSPPAASPDALPPQAPNMVLLYYGFDPRGPRDWTPDILKHYLAYHENRGTDQEKPVDTFFDTVLWMYRKSSRGALFETSAKSTPTKEQDWRECMDRLHVPGLQLNALEAAAATLEAKLKQPFDSPLKKGTGSERSEVPVPFFDPLNKGTGSEPCGLRAGEKRYSRGACPFFQRTVNVWVVLTLPYPDVRIANWAESPDAPQWDFRKSDESRLQAIQWYVRTSVEKWERARFRHLRLLGFYWFNEGHVNLRNREDVSDETLLTDLKLMGDTARFLHSLTVDGHRLTLTWVPYSPYGGERLGVIADLLKAEPTERIDYLMVQPNYFFPGWKKQRSDLVTLVRNAASIAAGVEIEFDASLARDLAARQRFFDYLQVIPQEHPHWSQSPAGYYEGLRTIHKMATQPDLAPCYDALYHFVRAHRPKPRDQDQAHRRETYKQQAYNETHTRHTLTPPPRPGHDPGRSTRKGANKVRCVDHWDSI